MRIFQTQLTLSPVNRLLRALPIFPSSYEAFPPLPVAWCSPSLATAYCFIPSTLNNSSMKRACVLLTIACFLPAALFPFCLNAQAPKLLLKPVIQTGLSQPMQVVHAGDNSQRLFIVQKGGTVKVFDRTTDESFTDRGTFITLTGLLTSGEQGLLSLAFDPAYATNGFFYLYFTNGDGNLELARYKVSADPYLGDVSTKLTLLVIPHPGEVNHNGGELHFGTDGMLYLSTGDGGGGGDIPNNAQTTTVFLGKILRINVNGATQAQPYQVPAGNPFGNAVYALGLRNPFRWSFDRQTGDAWIGDVGQGAREEIDYVPAGQLGGANFGWRCYEGDQPYNTAGCGPQNSYLAPTYAYANPANGRSVIGGVVYRGSGFPALQGYYVGTDYFNQDLHVIRRSGNSSVVEVQTAGIAFLSDFGESENGELYASNLGTNTIYRVTVDNPLPVTLTAFQVSAEGNGVWLNWQTTSEKAFDRFEILHSLNSRTWSEIGRQAGAGESSRLLRYTFRHDSPANGVNYYRLRMIDKDGSQALSPVRNVVMEERAFPLVVYPNPSSGERIFLKTPEPAFIRSVEVVNPTGVTVLKTLNGWENGLDTRLLGTGVYLLKITRHSGEVLSRRVSILR